MTRTLARLTALALLTATLTACDALARILEPNYCASHRYAYVPDTLSVTLGHWPTSPIGKTDTLGLLMGAPRHICLK